jgi:DNA replication protein DnaC
MNDLPSTTPEPTTTEPTKPSGRIFESVAEEMAKEWGVDLDALRNGHRPDPDERARRFIEQERLRDRTARFEADIGSEYRETDWEHPSLCAYLEASRKVMAWTYGRRGQLITGPSGRGKTRAVVALYKRLALEEAREVRYFNAADWFAMLGEEVRYGRDEARHFINRHARYPVFIMDDMGQQARPSKTRDEHAQAWFFRFLDIRRSEGLPLIMTTNLGAREIAASDEPNARLRTDPLMVRLFDLCEVVSYETDLEREERTAREKMIRAAKSR